MWYCKERENLTSLQTSWDLGGQKPKTIYNKGLNFIMENLKKFTKNRKNSIMNPHVLNFNS